MVAAAVACVVGAVAGPAPALADDPGVAISLTTVTPNIWSQGATLSISGTVANNTGQSLTGARVVTWASSTASTTWKDLAAALAAPATAAKGVTLETASCAQDLSADTKGVLANGAQAPFTVQCSPNLPTAGAAYLVGVEVLSQRGQVLARARVALGVQAAGAALGALVVPLTSRPSLVSPAGTGHDAPAVFSDDHLASELSGTLGTLIALAGQPGVTALIDPMLTAALAQMAGGYVVAAGDATPVPGKGQAAAQAALKSIDQIAAGGAAYRMPAGDPDVDALALLPQASSIMKLATKPPADSALASLPLAVLVRGAVGDDARTLIDGLAPSLVIADELQPDATLQADGQAGGATRWVALTPMSSLSDTTGPLPAFDGADALQPSFNRLARFVLAAGQGAPVVTLADDDASAGTAGAWLGAGWQPEALAKLVDGLTAAALDWSAGVPPVLPSPDLIAGVGQVQAQLSLWADLGDDQSASDALAARVLPGVAAAAWDGDWASALGWLQQATSELNAQVGTGDVTLYVAAQWHLSSSDNRVPITITNTMGIPVTVQVHFVSESPQRLTVPDTDFVTVEADNTAAVVVAPQASANGSVQVTATLVTRGGTTIGDAQQVQVIITAASRLGWIIIIGAGAAFVIATSLRVRQVRRQRLASRQASLDPAGEVADG